MPRTTQVLRDNTIKMIKMVSKTEDIWTVATCLVNAVQGAEQYFKGKDVNGDPITLEEAMRVIWDDRKCP